MVPLTKDRILDTAERLFAERGYSATSLRAIIAEAGVNLASVHYHFHSKEALLEAVFLRRAEPANQERLELLENCEREAGDRSPELERIIEAFIMPAFRAAQDPARGGPTYQRLVGRLYAEGDVMPRLVVKHFITLLLRFGSALEKALPDLPQEELYWRVQFAMGAVAHALRGPKDLEVFQGQLPEPAEADAMVHRLVNFLGAAFRAPVRGAVAKAAVLEEK